MPHAILILFSHSLSPFCSFPNACFISSHVSLLLCVLPACVHLRVFCVLGVLSSLSSLFLLLWTVTIVIVVFVAAGVVVAVSGGGVGVRGAATAAVVNFCLCRFQ